MALIERFEQLECWQSSRELVKSVYLACRSGELAKDFETRSQFKRAALSVMNNIAEGFGRRLSDREFIRFLCISEGSTFEVKSMTYALEDLDYLDPAVVAVIREKSDKTAAKTLGLIRYIRGRSKSKPK
jgi:four helix bundle protein